MKKLFVLVSCFALLLVMSNVSFAQEVVAGEVTPCTCCYCTAAAQALPAYTPHFATPKLFGGKLAGLASKCPLAPATAVVPSAALPLPPEYAVAAPHARPFAARRAARLAQQPLPPFPPAVAPAPPVFAPPVFAAEHVPQFPVAQMGDANRVLQRAGGAPVISFFSIVRSPRPAYDPYAAYYYQQQYGYPQPETPAQ